MFDSIAGLSNPTRRAGCDHTAVMVGKPIVSQQRSVCMGASTHRKGDQQQLGKIDKVSSAAAGESESQSGTYKKKKECLKNVEWILSLLE